MLTKNRNFSALYGKGLARLFREQYENSPIEYADPIIKRKLVPKKYALGFQISREMIEDDLYGGIVKVLKGRKTKLKVVTTYSIDGSFGRLKLENDMFRTEGLMSSLSMEDTKQLMIAFSMLYKQVKKPKKVVRRKRRKNAKA